MAKPYTHACSSARKFGGVPEDYIEIHNFMDSSKGAIASNKHRMLTHNAWFVAPNGPLEKCFGVAITNSDGKKIPTRSIGEQHILEDFGGVIPTAGDYAASMNYESWMNGQGQPPSVEAMHPDLKRWHWNEIPIKKDEDGNTNLINVTQIRIKSKDDSSNKKFYASKYVLDEDGEEVTYIVPSYSD